MSAGISAPEYDLVLVKSLLPKCGGARCLLIGSQIFEQRGGREEPDDGVVAGLFRHFHPASTNGNIRRCRRVEPRIYRETRTLHKGIGREPSRLLPMFSLFPREQR